MILAAPLVIPFSKAVPTLAGLTGLLGMTALSDKVNQYIQDNPEESMKILSTIIPGVGIGEIFMSKESEDDVEVEDDGEEKKKSKKEIVLGELGKEKGNYSDPEAEGSYESKRGRIIRGLEDAGKIRKGPDPNYDPSKKFQGYKKFIRRRRADGGAIGIEVLFEPKRKELRYGGDTMGGPNDRSKNQGPAGGASAGGNYGGNVNPNQTYGGGADASKFVSDINVQEEINKAVTKKLSEFVPPSVDYTKQAFDNVEKFRTLRKNPIPFAPFRFDGPKNINKTLFDNTLSELALSYPDLEITYGS
jgi:hypothetical protein